jgi:hypothetical protein
MAWLIFLCFLVVMISPVMWILPSGRRRRVAARRSAVMEGCISVRLKRPPWHNEAGVMQAYHWP